MSKTGDGVAARGPVPFALLARGARGRRLPIARPCCQNRNNYPRQWSPGTSPVLVTWVLRWGGLSGPPRVGDGRNDGKAAAFGQRGHSAGRMGGRRQGWHGVPRHALDGNAREPGQARGRLLRVVAEREGRARGGHRVGHGGRPHARDHEARGRERRGGPVHVRREHGRERGPRGAGRGRPVVLQLAERAGLPHVRGVRAHPVPGPVRLAGGLRVQPRGICAVRALRHPRHAARDHAHRAHAHHGRARGRARGRAAA